jgi:hypothetical protein
MAHLNVLAAAAAALYMIGDIATLPWCLADAADLTGFGKLSRQINRKM